MVEIMFFLMQKMRAKNIPSKHYIVSVATFVKYVEYVGSVQH